MIENLSRKPVSENGKKAVGLSLVGAIVAGSLASACCIGPLVLVFLGISSAGALIALEPYRPYFMILMLIFLVGAFYVTYRKPKTVDCETAEVCCNNGSKKIQKIILWVAALFALAMLFTPQILLMLLD